MAVSETILNHVHESLRDLSAGAVSAKTAELAAHYGVTPATVNRWAAAKGLRWRKEKASKGSSAATRAALLEASTLQYLSKRTSQQITLPACDAKEILEDSGVQTGVSTSRFLSRMRQEKISGQDLLRPSPHVTLLSDHPNHVWQFDVTNCLQYFLDEKKGLGERDAEMTLYKNKIVKTAKAIKRELLRYAVVDHCSGAFYFRYFYATGERAVDGSQFLFEAMRPKDELIKRTWNGESGAKLGKFRFHGVPLILVADRGSIVSAKANQALFDYLRIQLETHMPGNPRAKGAIEGLMHIINRFEGRLKLQRPADLDELNRWALDWCIAANGVKMMRGVAPRSVLWSYITAEQLRLCPEEEIYRRGIKEPTLTRTADGACLIGLDGQSYQVPDPQAAKQQVSVVRHPYEYPAVEVHFNGFVWLCQPIPVDQYGRLTNGVHYGEYRGIKHTETQQAKGEMEKIGEGWGLTWKGTGDKRRAEAPPAGQASPLTVFGHQADKVGNVEFIERRGTPLELKPAEDVPENAALTTSAAVVSRGIAARRISFVEFLKRLSAEIGVIAPEMNRTLRERYSSGIEVKEAEEVITSIVGGTWGAEERTSAVVGG
ncbi:MAG: transposase family protein [Syntrophales bacterium]